MNKPKFLRILSLTAAALSGIGIMLNIVTVLNPHIAAVLMGYGSVKELMETKLSETTQNLMLAQAAVPAVLFLLCIINCFADKISRKRSLCTLIFGACAYISMALLVNFLYTFAIRSAVNDSISAVQLLSSITTIRSILSYLYTFSLVTLMCSASVEYYISRSVNND